MERPRSASEAATGRQKIAVSDERQVLFPLRVLRERVRVRVFCLILKNATETRNAPHPSPLPEYREREKSAETANNVF